ncbi:MAG TPA: malate dehydrogenase, partial [bacterium]|nr:malate dehydrogenase [bacterium]
LNGEYGLSDLYLGVPVKLGAGGVEEVVSLNLTVEERSMLRQSAEVYKESISHLTSV